MIREGTPVRCSGSFRGNPCRRFLGVFVAVYGGIKCSRCGHWNEIQINPGDNVKAHYLDIPRSLVAN